MGAIGSPRSADTQGTPSPDPKDSGWSPSSGLDGLARPAVGPWSGAAPAGASPTHRAGKELSAPGISLGNTCAFYIRKVKLPASRGRLRQTSGHRPRPAGRRHVRGMKEPGDGLARLSRRISLQVSEGQDGVPGLAQEQEASKPKNTGWGQRTLLLHLSRHPRAAKDPVPREGAQLPCLRQAGEPHPRRDGAEI